MATVLSVEPEASLLPSTFQATEWIFELCAEKDFTDAFLNESWSLTNLLRHELEYFILLIFF